MKKTMFPREFVEWIGRCELYRTIGKDGAWLFQTEPYIIWKSTDELYEHWLLYIKNKEDDKNN